METTYGNILSTVCKGMEIYIWKYTSMQRYATKVCNKGMQKDMQQRHAKL